jgi:hypothetical protein
MYFFVARVREIDENLNLEVIKTENLKSLTIKESERTWNHVAGGNTCN